MANSKNVSHVKIILIALAFAVGIGAVVYYQKSRPQEGVFAYDASTDRSFIVDLFKKDWYLLISDYSKNYSVEDMLDYRAPSESTDYRGSLIIKTYRVKDKPVGFVAYYPREFREGWLLFLGVDKESRQKGYARKMVQYVIDDFKKHGMRVVRLLTRTDNEKGRKLYTSFGFKEYWTDGAYVKYELYLDK